MHIYTTLVSTIVSVGISSALASGCRCGPPEFLSIPRVNLTVAATLRPCTPYKLLDARGTAEPQTISLMFQLAVQKLLTNSTDITSQSIVYPASYDQNVTSGVQYMSDTIKLGLEDCPNQQFFLLGYSQGATVVLETLDKIDDRSSAAIAGVVLVGNPYRKPGRLSNVDEMNRHDNRTAFGTFAAQAMKTNDSIPAYSKELDQSGRVKDICLENDTICASDPKCGCHLENGQIATDHLSYGLMQDVQNLIVEHITLLM